MDLFKKCLVSYKNIKMKAECDQKEQPIIEITCKKYEIEKFKEHSSLSEALCSPYNCLVKENLIGFTNLEAIVSLSLSGCLLNTLPKCITKFNIKELKLSNNQFFEVPECLINCKYLEKLDLSNNKLREFEIEPAFVQKLCYLNLEHNQIINIPEWILSVKCFNLEEFNYSYNKVKDLSSAKFNKVSHYELKRVELRNCYLFNEDFVFLNSIRRLQYLDISNTEGFHDNNTFTNCDKLFHKPSWCDTIVTLKLNNLKLSTLPEEIGCLIKLKELEISKNELMWLPVSFCDLKNLEILDISDNQLVEIPENFYKLEKLSILKAANNHIVIIKNVRLLPNLVYLDFYNNDLDLPELCMDFLKFVDLEENYFSSNDFESVTFEQYKEKKIALRNILNKTRKDGSKIISTDFDLSEDEHKESSDESVCEQNVNTSSYYELENWDDPKSEYSDNGCTESDNEWRGCDDYSIQNMCSTVSKKHTNTVITKWPSYLFEDASE